MTLLTHSIHSTNCFFTRMIRINNVSILIVLLLLTVLISAEKIEINVKTGEKKSTKVNATASGAMVEHFDEWPSDHIDLSNVEIRNEGEDATGSMSPLDLMIRSFEKLPDIEQDRIGFTAMKRKATEAGLPMDVNDLYAIWNVRQAELKEAIEAISDTAEVLLKLIKQLDNAVQSAQIVDNVALQPYDEDAALEALYQLEDYLSDVDNARDFHEALKGWPVLTSLLSPKPRWRSTLNSERGESTAEIQAKLSLISSQSITPESIRGMAALVVGTAVKNEAKYSRWVLESVVRTLEHSDELIRDVKVEDTVIAALLDILSEQGISQAAQRQALYALGSSIRHNMPAQAVFNALEGTDILMKSLQATEGLTKGVFPLRTKLVNLVVDLLEEAYHEKLKTSDTQNSAIIDIGEVMSQATWEDLIARLSLDFPHVNEPLTNLQAKLHEAGVRALKAQWRYSSKNSTLAKEQLLKLKVKYELMISESADESEYISDVYAQIVSALELAH